MTKARLIIFVLFSLITGKAICQPTGLFRGKIGNEEIVLQLQKAEDSSIYMVSYFSFKDKTPHNYERRSMNDDTLVFVSTIGETAELILVSKGIGYKGLWQSEEQKLPVILIPVTLEKYPNPYENFEEVSSMKNDNPLAYIFSSLLKPQKDSLIIRNGYRIHYLMDTTITVSFVQVENKTRNKAIDSINRQLKRNWLSECVEYFDCVGMTYTPDYTSYVEGIYITNAVFSVQMCNSFYCGGAHPDWGCNALNFDMATGRKLELGDVISFGDDNDNEIFAEKLVELWKRLYKKEMKIDKSEDGCDYTSTEPWEYVEWHFTKKGLYIGASFSHAMAACNYPEWSIIPYSILAKYRNKKVKLNLPLK